MEYFKRIHGILWLPTQKLFLNPKSKYCNFPNIRCAFQALYYKLNQQSFIKRKWVIHRIHREIFLNYSIYSFWSNFFLLEVSIQGHFKNYCVALYQINLANFSIQFCVFFRCCTHSMYFQLNRNYFSVFLFFMSFAPQKSNSSIFRTV